MYLTGTLFVVISCLAQIQNPLADRDFENLFIYKFGNQGDQLEIYTLEF